MGGRRFLFLAPQERTTLLGTWYAPAADGSEAELVARGAAALLAEFRAACPALELDASGRCGISVGLVAAQGWAGAGSARRAGGPAACLGAPSHGWGEQYVFGRRRKIHHRARRGRGGDRPGDGGAGASPGALPDGRDARGRGRPPRGHPGSARAPSGAGGDGRAPAGRAPAHLARAARGSRGTISRPWHGSPPRSWLDGPAKGRRNRRRETTARGRPARFRSRWREDSAAGPAPVLSGAGHAAGRAHGARVPERPRTPRGHPDAARGRGPRDSELPDLPDSAAFPASGTCARASRSRKCCATR